MSIQLAKGEAAISIDEAAILAGGADGGAYLDGIGITDMASLNKAQWVLFCQRIVTGTLVAAIDNFHKAASPF